MLNRSVVIAMAGAVLTCPNCHDRIGTLRKTLYTGWNFGLDAIRFERRQEPDKLRPAAACRKCGASYAETDTHILNGKVKMQMLVHTDHGWLPKPPPNAPPPPIVPMKPAA